MISTSSVSKSVSTTPSDTKLQESSSVDLMDEVEALGLELNAQLISLVA
ncbi:MAG: hypothetical protein PUP92_24380 [Rhizonema sp. PD38]|nr:hypothetical protein [Rhizonema sp. PD38]